MTPNQYQSAALSTAIFPEEVAFSYLPMKLSGEAGEVSEKIGKLFRKHGNNVADYLDSDPAYRNELAKEIGDVQWYIAVLSAKLRYSLSDIMEMNLNKLADRKDRGVLDGNGDNR